MIIIMFILRLSELSNIAWTFHTFVVHKDDAQKEP